MPLTNDHIEDWDFRGEPEPGSEKDAFFRANFVDIQAIDLIRLSILSSAVELGYAKALEDGEHLAVIPNRAEDFRRWVTTGGLPATSRLTPNGRRWRRVGKSLWREWEKYGRVRLRLRSELKTTRRM